MGKEICISSTPHETRLAILEDDQLAEIYYERENEYTLAGSIYNGRVTRVLPGMQSAFVDLGLERDAFLYVTDFIELEDQAEAEELEQAAASGANQPPREVRHGNGGRRDENGHRGAAPKPSEERRLAEQEGFVGSTPEAAEGAIAGEGAATPAEESGAQQGRRWRGRRHRRDRGRSTSAPDRTAAEIAEKSNLDISYQDEMEATDVAPSIHASSRHSEDIEYVHAESPERGDRAQPTAEPFVLPGESLSKYGGMPDAPHPAGERKQPEPVITSRPSTLIEAPLEWDGSGLLPGESLARHRDRREETTARISGEAAVIEPAGESDQAAAAQQTAAEGEAPAAVQDGEAEPDAEIGAVAVPDATPALEEEARPEAAGDILFAEREDDVPGHDGPEFEVDAETELGTVSAEPTEGTNETAQPNEGYVEDESNASASHRVDPVSPSGFRIFGLGSKKKQEQPVAEMSAEEAEPVAAAAVATAPSSFAPGSGLVEEEVIEGEEFEAVPHHHRHNSEGGDLDDYEEETLAAQIRSGGLGEMLQEAHLDHRIDVTFGEKNGEEEIEGGEEEESSIEAQPVPGHLPRERGGRSRRGRSLPGRGERRGPSRRSVQATEVPIISELLKPGQEILVQIAKEPIAKKGARITSHIALPGRFLVYMPTVSHVGVSRKIASDDERHRLKRVLIHERGDASGGFIVRTAAEGASEEELRADLRFLIHLWDEIKQRSEASKSPALIYHDLSLIERILRDQVSADFSNIWVDSEADYERIVRFLNRFSPSLVRRVKLYTKETPLFEHFGIQDEISKALRSKVWLKSGGSIVINQTEALVAIDINTGKYVGKSARLEDTILKTNLDAVPEIVRQIRLRDLGGIIVIDFIDMDERKNRFKVMAALEEALKSDRAPTKVLQFNDFGLVAITRKRVKQSLERTLSIPCPTCQATGMVKSPATVCNEIWVEMRKMRRHFESGDVMLRVHPETVKVLKSGGGRWLSELEELVGKNILVKSDPALHPEQFDIQG